MRLRGELVAAGIRRRGHRDSRWGPTSARSLEKLAPASAGAATALVAVVASADPGSAELWVIDRVTGKTVVREGERRRRPTPPRVRRGAGGARRRAPARELPRAGDPRRPASIEAPPPPPMVVERFATATLEEADWTWAVEAGGGTADAIDGPVERDPLGRADRARLRAAILRADHLRRPRDRRARRHAGGLRRRCRRRCCWPRCIVRFRRGRRIRADGLARRRDAAPRRRQPRVGALRGGERRTLGRGGATRASACACRCAATGSSWASRCMRSSPSPTRRSASSRPRWRAPGRPTLIGSVTLLGGI